MQEGKPLSMADRVAIGSITGTASAITECPMDLVRRRERERALWAVCVVLYMCEVESANLTVFFKGEIENASAIQDIHWHWRRIRV